jgi:hypothetical protein
LPNELSFDDGGAPRTSLWVENREPGHLLLNPIGLLG